MVLRLLIIFIFCFFSNSFSNSLENGVVDLSHLGSNGFTKIFGDASLYYRKLLTNRDIDSVKPSAKIFLPGVWNGITVDSTTIKGEAYCTIAFKVVVPDSLKEKLSIYIPTIFSAYRFYIDDSLVYHLGRVYKNPKRVLEVYKPVTLQIPVKKDTSNFIFQIVNVHNDKGGPWKPLFIGSANGIAKYEISQISHDIFFVSSLFIFFLVYILIYSIMKKDEQGKIALNYSLFTLMTMLNLTTNNISLINVIFPNVSTSIVVHLDYLSNFLSVLFYSEYTYRLYKENFSDKVRNITSLFILTSISLILLTPLNVFVNLIPIFQLYTISMLIYFIIVGILYIKLDKVKATILILSNLILLVAAFHDILQNRAVNYTVTWVPIGALLVSILQSYLVSSNMIRLLKEREEGMRLTTILNSIITSFIPQQFFKLIGKTPTNVKLGDYTNRTITIMFCNYSIDETEKEEDEDKHIFIKNTIDIINNNGGVIDKVLDDTIMALFFEDDTRAIETAVEVVSVFNNSMIEPHIGINKGYTTFGVIGTNDRMATTVIGDSVNIASRMMSLGKKVNANIVLANSMVNSGFYNIDNFHIRKLGSIHVKGKREMLPIVEIFSEYQKLGRVKLQTRAELEQAITLIELHRQGEAIKILENVMNSNQCDRYVEHIYNKCKKAINNDT